MKRLVQLEVPSNLVSHEHITALGELAKAIPDLDFKPHPYIAASYLLSYIGEDEDWHQVDENTAVREPPTLDERREDIEHETEILGTDPRNWRNR